jgi:hypothetical protein
MTKIFLKIIIANPSRLPIVESIEGNPPTNKKQKPNKKMNNTENQLITLKEGQTVRGAGFSRYSQRITVRTARGYAAKYNEDQDAAYNRAVANGHETVWTYQEPAVLCADYPGKAEAHAAKLKEIAEAVELFDGQAVIIDGEKLIVRISGERFSNPIQFINLNLDI